MMELVILLKYFRLMIKDYIANGEVNHGVYMSKSAIADY